MAIELKVPVIGESINEVMIAKWLKAEGQPVALDEPLVEVESDKATLEVPSPVSGVLLKHVKREQEMARVGDVIALLEEVAGQAAATAPAKREAPAPAKAAPARKVSAPEVAPTPATTAPQPEPPAPAAESAEPHHLVESLPAAKRVLAERGLNAEQVTGTGKGGRVLKEDVQRYTAPADTPSGAVAAAITALPAGPREEQSVPMSPIRRTIAKRLVESQQTTALLTTFNEIELSAVIELRKRHREQFQEHYGVKLGFMSFFVKATVEALKAYPQVNARIESDTIVYHNYYDIGIAVGGGKGLVVPVLRNAERLSFAELEVAIADFGTRAQANRLELSELAGGTFTISNGGVYGSLLSTPIVNPPQSGVLGLHAIQERPVARDGQVVIRPMMYVALTYDHRLIDGRESVGFLKRIKEVIEDPARMLLEI